MKKATSELHKKLKDRAKSLARAGYSPIPVHGNNAPMEPKRPALPWRPYQTRIASEAEIEDRFNQQITALGIVCGRISELLVIDFDDTLRYQRFCRHLPQFADTYTVKTKRGFHLYFRTAQKVPSHQFDGGDIKGERSYVVAPPSVIGNFVYQPVKDIGKRQLTKADIDQLLNYFHVNATGHSVIGKTIKDATELDLERLYRRLAPRMGRNNALYRVASIAREAGMNKSDAAKRLLKLHVEARSRPGHKAESFAERWQEGKRTIASAYGKSGRAVTRGDALPNSVRERLLKSQGSTVVARLLDIFLLAGWRPESFFTLGEAIALAERYGLNRKSVMQALTGEYSRFDGRHIITRRYVEYLDIEGLNLEKRGRPVELVFQAPSVARLLSVLNVGRSPGDQLGIEDVRSARSYRMAVHREYIRRLSPRSSLAVLAARLGVNERTIRRYNRALEVQVSACVGRLALTRAALAELPKRGWRAVKNTTNGFWLERDDGSRLPGWRHIGSKLLNAGGGRAHICVRRASIFCLERVRRPAVEFEKLTLRQFSRLLVLRGQRAGAGGVLGRVGELMRKARGRAAALQYEKVQLYFGTVEARIPEDKIAETISGYLFARDSSGAEVRRPARRGIAYRMLKEHGNGNVYLAVRSSYREMMMSLARHALRAGDADHGLELLARAQA